MNKLILFTLFIFLSACTPKIEYREVYIPVKVDINRPERPVYTDADKPVNYLIEVLNYTRKLENLIDTYNGSVDER